MMMRFSLQPPYTQHQKNENTTKSKVAVHNHRLLLSSFPKLLWNAKRLWIWSVDEIFIATPIHTTSENQKHNNIKSRCTQSFIFLEQFFKIVMECKDVMNLKCSWDFHCNPHTHHIRKSKTQQNQKLLYKSSHAPKWEIQYKLFRFCENHELCICIFICLCLCFDKMVVFLRMQKFWPQKIFLGGWPLRKTQCF